MNFIKHFDAISNMSGYQENSVTSRFENVKKSIKVRKILQYLKYVGILSLGNSDVIFNDSLI